MPNLTYDVNGFLKTAVNSIAARTITFFNNAKGLSSAQTLSAGQVLVIPNKITNIHNNASTFKPYDQRIAADRVMRPQRIEIIGAALAGMTKHVS